MTRKSTEGARESMPWNRAGSWRTFAWSACLLAAPWLAAAHDAKEKRLPNLDVRVSPEKASAAMRSALLPERDTAVLSAANRFTRNHPGTEVVSDQIFGTPVRLRGGANGLTSGTVSKATTKDAATIVRGFVAENADVFGIPADVVDSQVLVDASSADPSTGRLWVRLAQNLGGIPVFQGELTANVGPDGSVRQVVSSLAPGLREEKVASTAGVLTAEQALSEAIRHCGHSLDAVRLVRSRNTADPEPAHFAPTDEFSVLTASKVVFASTGGKARLAWKTVHMTATEAYLCIVDSQTGDLLFRKDIMNDQAQVATYSYLATDSPAPQTLMDRDPVPYQSSYDPSLLAEGEPVRYPQAPNVSFTQTTVLPAGLLPAGVNATGWISDNNNSTRGNNVAAYLDQITPDGPSNVDNVGRAYGTYAFGVSGPSALQRNFTFGNNIALPPDGADEPLGLQTPSDLDNASITNVFVWGNIFHDILYTFGFTEASRNFQNQNFGRGGKQEDGVNLEVQDYSGTYNANFATPPDGTPGKAQFFLSEPADTPTTPSRDSAFDQHVIIHEMTHGLTNRMVGDASGLVYKQGGGLGEGWSDFFALGILDLYHPTIAADGIYPVAQWGLYGVSCLLYDNYFYGLRRFPYSSNFKKSPLTLLDLSGEAIANPLTYYSGGIFRGTDPADIPENPLCLGLAGAEVHNLGEIWAVMLWQYRSLLLKAWTAAPTLAQQRDAVKHSLQVVFDGLRLTELNPTFTSARDSIIDAAIARKDFANPAGFVSPDPTNNPTMAQIDELLLWKAFAQRGNGFSASVPSNTDVGSTLNPLSRFYHANATRPCRGSTANFFPDIGSTTPVEFDTDELIKTVTLPSPIRFYGQTWTSVQISKFGFVAFSGVGPPDPTDVVTDHFARVQISALYADWTSSSVGIADDGTYVYVLFDKMQFDGPPPPDAPPDAPPGSPESRFAIRFSKATATVETIDLAYDTVVIPPGKSAVVGLARGTGDEKSLPTTDFSELSSCNLPDDPDTGYFEYFSDGNAWDLDGRVINFTAPSVEVFNTELAAAFDHPIRVGDALVVDGNDSTISPDGETVTLQFPISNEFKLANLTGVLGVLYSLTPVGETGPVIITNTTNYGTIRTGDAVNGGGFQVQFPGGVPCGTQYKFAVLYAANPGITPIDIIGSQEITVEVGKPTSLGPLKGELVYPSIAPTFSITADVPAAPAGSISTIAVSVPPAVIQAVGIKSGTFMRNATTNEVVEITAFDYRNPTAMSIRRATSISAVTGPAMAAGQVFNYESIPIPDSRSPFETRVSAANAGSAFDGPVSGIEVIIDEIRHQRIGDLTIQLVSPDNLQTVVLVDQLRAQDGLTKAIDFRNITFNDVATPSAQAQVTLNPGTSYRPAQKLDLFRQAGINIKGIIDTNWKLQVIDNQSPVSGELVSWRIRFYASPTAVCDTVQARVTSKPNETGANGWTPLVFGDASAASTALSNGRLVMHVDPSSNPRSPAWQSPGADLDLLDDSVYRFRAWISRSGQTNPLDQSQIPNLRIRAAVRYAQSNIGEWWFDKSQGDPQSEPAMLANAPSTDPSNPTEYAIDFAPLDVPALKVTPFEKVRGTVEAYAVSPNQIGNLEISEARIERYAEPKESDGTVVATMGPADFAAGVVTRGHLANPGVFGDGPSVTFDARGATLDSSASPATNISFAGVDFRSQAGNVLLQPGKSYRIRWNIDGSSKVENGAQLRLRARTIKFGYTEKFEIGDAQSAGATNNLIAAQTLPGFGSLNPNRNLGQTNGGWYTQYFSVPPIMPSNDSLRRLMLGFDVVDFAGPSALPAQQTLEGRYRLNSVEVFEFDRR